MSSFVTTQLSTGLDSDNDVQEVRIKKLDSTQLKIVQSSNSGSEGIPSAQATQKKKKQCACIASTSSIEKQEEKHEVDTEDDPEAAVVMELQQKKADLEDRCREMEKKLLEQRMDNMFRQYQDDIREEINKFRGILMSAYGKDFATEESVLKVRENLQNLCSTEQYMGYMRRVGPDFVERVEQSLLSGQVPEWQMNCTKTNNSTEDPILGHVVDVVYKIGMPFIVKSEKLDNNDNNDLVLIGVTPGIPMSAVPVNVTVKKEKIEDSQES